MTDTKHINSEHSEVFQRGFLYSTFYFFKEHFLVITTLGLVAGFGRVIQLGGFGEISSATKMALEVLIEGARLWLVLYVLGLASLKNGFLKVRQFFIYKRKRKKLWSSAVLKLKTKWTLILVNFIGFALIAFGMNVLIDVMAYQTCLLLSLKQGGVLAPASSEWTILLFFKNVSVIPFTIIFEMLFFIWLTTSRSLMPAVPWRSNATT